MTVYDLLFLTNTDTTIGFLCQDSERLDREKKRPSGRPYLVTLPTLKSLQKHTRVPRPFRHHVRRSNKTTFIYPNGRSFRVVHDVRHLLLLRRLHWAYSTSANLSNHPYEETWARSRADIVVEPIGKPDLPSRILKIGKKRLMKLR